MFFINISVIDNEILTNLAIPFSTQGFSDTPKDKSSYKLPRNLIHKEKLKILYLVIF